MADEDRGWFIGLLPGLREKVLNGLRDLGRDECAEQLATAHREYAEAELAAKRAAEAPNVEDTAATTAAMDALAKRPTSELLVELAESVWRFVADHDGDVWAEECGERAGTVLRLRGKSSVRSVLSSRWREQHGHAPPESALRQALDVIEGQALDGPREQRPPRYPWGDDSTIVEGPPEDSYDDLEHEDGAELLAEVEVLLRRFVAFPSDSAVVATALWAVHTHAVEAFDSSPRLAPVSPEPQCGKTRLLEVLELLCRRPRHVMNSTVAYLFRVVELERPTILFDEVDTIFGPKADRANEDLRGLLNAGHRRGATVGRMQGEGAAMVPKEFDVYAPAALAGIGDLPPTLMSRAVVLRMRRRASGEYVEPFRRRDVEEQAAPVQRRLAAWGARHLDALTAARPDMPPGVEDRPADCWEPLLAVADEAGGDWPARARKACTDLVTAEHDTAQSHGVRLLAGIQLAFMGMATDRMWSEDLCKHLNADEDAGWGGWNEGKGIGPRDLAARLKAFGVASREVRAGDRTRKGYLRGDFTDAWARYLGATSATSATDQVNGAEGTEQPSATERNSRNTGDDALRLLPHVADEGNSPAAGVTCDVAAVAAVAASNGHPSRDAGYWASVDAGDDLRDKDGAW